MPNMSMPSMSMTAAVATMTAALSTMSALSAMPNLPALPTITNKPPPMPVPNTANIEEVKRKVTQKANSISIKELTEVRPAGPRSDVQCMQRQDTYL